MVREPDLETVNRALSSQITKLMEELKKADRTIASLQAQLLEATRMADVERGRG